MSPDPVEDNLPSNTLDDATKSKWYRVVFELKKLFGKKPDMNALLFLIGMQEYGQTRPFSKEEKMDLMHLATCKLLSYEGYYTYSHTDEDGWPHYDLVKKPPYGNLADQENLLKKLTVKYYEENNLLDFQE